MACSKSAGLCALALYIHAWFHAYTNALKPSINLCQVFGENKMLPSRALWVPDLIFFNVYSGRGRELTLNCEHCAECSHIYGKKTFSRLLLRD